MIPRRVAFPIVLFASLALVASCSDNALLMTGGHGILDILPRQTAFHAIGDTIRLDPGIVTSDGGRVAPATQDVIMWRSNSPDVATVDSEGLVTARGNGAAIVFGSMHGQVDSVVVEVAQAPARVDAGPDTTSLRAIGSTAQLSAQVFDANGVEMAGAELEWYSTDPSVADVNGHGQVTARGEGSAGIVVASALGTSLDTVVVRVDLVPQSVYVVIKPDSARMLVDESIQLVATATSGYGTPVEGVEFAWESLSPEVAIVDMEGRVTAKAAGVAMVIVSAVCCGVADTAEVIVDPNQSSVEPLFTDDFEGYSNEEKISGQGYNGFIWTGNVPVSGTHAYSGSKSLRFSFQGNPDLSDDSWVEQRFRLPDVSPEIWMEFMLRVPENFQHRDAEGPDNNKLWALWAGDYSNNRMIDAEITMEFTRIDDTSSRSRLSVAHGDGDASGGWHERHDTKGILFDASMRGKWVQIRVHILLDHSGHVRMWRDGVLVYELSNYDLWGTGGINQFENGYLMGWANSGYSEDTDYFIDNFKIYNSNPGW